MKILILQLTRLGDIYLTWPVVRALRRKYPDADIQMMVRERFAGATEGLKELSSVRHFNAREIIAPLIQVEPNPNQSVSLLDQLVTSLALEKFDLVFNLTFSPFSAGLCRQLEKVGVATEGYSRFNDGTLRLRDSFSQYFYAQTGRQYSSRIHLVKLFAAICGVDLEPGDWSSNEIKNLADRSRQILIHIGGSESHKSVSATKWISAISAIRSWWKGSIGLIGSAEDAGAAGTIFNSLPTDSVENFVGQLSLAETFQKVRDSQLVIGPDSSPMHMASLVKTPCLNLSSSSVRFWETGPLSAHSIVLPFANEVDLSAESISGAARSIVENLPYVDGYKVVENPHLGLECYSSLKKDTPSDYAWDLIKALYFEGEIPKSKDPNIALALSEIYKMNEVILDALQNVSAGKPISQFSGVLNRSDEVLVKIGEILPAINPLIRKCVSSKVNIGPGDFSKILQETIQVHNDLHAETDCLLAACFDETEVTQEVP